MPCRLTATLAAYAILLTIGILPAAAQASLREKIASIDVTNADFHAVVPVPAPQVNADQTIALSAGANVTLKNNVYTLYPFGAKAVDLNLPTDTQPKSIKTTAHLVEIRTTFVIAKTFDVDALGINFNLVPLSTSANTIPVTQQKPLFLKYATGNIPVQMYQMLTQQNRTSAKVISVPVVRTSDNVPVTISVDEAVPDFTQPNSDSDVPNSLPQVKRLLQVQGRLTLIPRVNADHSITLSFSFSQPPTRETAMDKPTVQLSPIASDDTLVISGTRSAMGRGGFSLETPAPGKIISRSQNLHSDGQVLLIFITPTILSDKTKVLITH